MDPFGKHCSSEAFRSDPKKAPPSSRPCKPRCNPCISEVYLGSAFKAPTGSIDSQGLTIRASPRVPAAQVEMHEARHFTWGPKLTLRSPARGEVGASNIGVAQPEPQKYMKSEPCGLCFGSLFQAAFPSQRLHVRYSACMRLRGATISYLWGLWALALFCGASPKLLKGPLCRMCA